MFFGLVILQLKHEKISPVRTLKGKTFALNGRFPILFLVHLGGGIGYVTIHLADQWKDFIYYIQLLPSLTTKSTFILLYLKELISVILYLTSNYDLLI